MNERWSYFRFLDDDDIITAVLIFYELSADIGE
jgi:hypothetical protein